MDSSKEVEFYGSTYDLAGKEHENIRTTVKASAIILKYPGIGARIVIRRLDGSSEIML